MTRNPNHPQATLTQLLTAYLAEEDRDLRHDLAEAYHERVGSGGTKAECLIPARPGNVRIGRALVVGLHGDHVDTEWFDDDGMRRTAYSVPNREIEVRP